MVEFVVRDARYDEDGFVAEVTRLLTLEMEQYGGRKATMDESSWQRVAVAIKMIKSLRVFGLQS